MGAAIGSDGLGQHATARVILICTVAALGGFLFGIDTAVINGAVDAIRGNFALSPLLTGFAVSCALVGSAVGAWFAGSLADRYGRLRTMQVAALLFVISSLGSGLVTGVAGLIAWRFVGGLGIGIASVIAPTYIAEVAPARIRGRLGSMQQMAIVLGIFAALLSDALLAHSAGASSASLWFGLAAWRWMFIVAAVPALLYGLLTLSVPESPRHLVAKGRLADARAVLEKVLNMHNAPALDKKMGEIEASLQADRAPRLRDLLGGRFGLLPIVWVGILLSIFQQFIGINVIFYYSTTLWHSVGFSEADSLTITVVTSIINVAATVVAILLVDRLGRKPLLAIGSAGMALTLGIMAWCFSQATGSGAAISLPGSIGTVALVAANAYVVFFGLSWGPVVWVLLGEMFPNRIRAIGLAVAAAAQWVANFAVTSTFPKLAEISLPFAYGLYAGFALVSLLFVLYAVRETKGIELEDMQA